MRFSVVIATYNRSEFLRDTLNALKHQTFKNFEVIVVNGPSTDDTAFVLQDFSKTIKSLSIDQRSLGRARNVGIDAAAGDIIAFIDDDALPHPNWLSELASAFDDDEVAAAGGLVYDSTGITLQYKYSSCDRLGRTDFQIAPPFDDLNKPGANRFLYLQGTNMAFRKNALRLIGGFDDGCEYLHDETDVCMRIIDKGLKIRPLNGATVYHRVAPSYMRDKAQVVKHVFIPVKNHIVFLLRASQGRYAAAEIEAEILKYTNAVIAGAKTHRELGRLSDTEYEQIVIDVQLAASEGRRIGLTARPFRTFSFRDEFVRFVTQSAATKKRRSICYVSREYPPAAVGGIGTFTADIAIELAKQGHDVHVVTCHGAETVIQLSNGVWVHQIAEQNPPHFLAADPARWLLTLAMEVYKAVDAVHRQSPLDLVVAPVWLSEGLLVALDKRWPTIIWLQTSARAVAQIDPLMIDNERTATALEAASVANADAVHAISNFILESAYRQYEKVPHPFVAPLGIHDEKKPPSASPSLTDVLASTEGKKRVLFVGRLEPRKGIDILLDAIPEVLKRAPETAFLIVGRPVSLQSLNGQTFQELFVRAHGASYSDRVLFLEELPVADRNWIYEISDLFCAPSRFESFGLVLLEAMRSSLPLVVSDIESFSEITSESGCSWSFQSGSISDLAQRLVEAIKSNSPEKSAAARMRFETNFEITIAARRLSDRFDAVIDAFQVTSKREAGFKFRRQLTQLLLNLTDGFDRHAARLAESIEAYVGSDAITEHVFDIFGAPPRQFVKQLHELFEIPLSPRQWLFAHHRIRKRGGRLMYLRQLISRTNLGRSLLDPEIQIQLLEVARRTAPREFTERKERVLASSNSRLRLRDMTRYLQRLVSYLRHPGLNSEYVRSRVDLLAQSNLQQSERLEKLEEALVSARRIVEANYSGLVTTGARLDTELDFIKTNLEAYASRGIAIKGAISEIDQKLSKVLEMALKSTENINGAAKQRADDLQSATSRIADRIEFLRQELFYEMEARGLIKSIYQSTSKQTLVKNQKKIDDLRARGALRVNLGCGHIPIAGYINCDRRDLPDVDVVGAADDLPFKPGELAEIHSAHFLEHFSLEMLQRRFLPYWKSLLQPDGVFRLIVPDAEAMIKSYATGEMTFDDLRIVTFGAQEYEGDYHFNMFSRESITRLLENTGFKQVCFVEVGRRNGLCFEMEVEARC